MSDKLFPLSEIRTRSVEEVMVLRSKLSRILAERTERDFPPGTHTMFCAMQEVCQWMLMKNTKNIDMILEMKL